MVSAHLQVALEDGQGVEGREERRGRGARVHLRPPRRRVADRLDDVLRGKRCVGGERRRERVRWAGTTSLLFSSLLFSSHLRGVGGDGQEDDVLLRVVAARLEEGQQLVPALVEALLAPLRTGRDEGAHTRGTSGQGTRARTREGRGTSGVKAPRHTREKGTARVRWQASLSVSRLSVTGTRGKLRPTFEQGQWRSVRSGQPSQSHLHGRVVHLVNHHHQQPHTQRLGQESVLARLAATLEAGLELACVPE